MNYTIGRRTNEPNFSRGSLTWDNRLQLYPTVCDKHFTCGEEGKNGTLVGKCKIQMNQLTAKISDSSCNTSYVWLGGEVGKAKAEEGNNNVITIK